jgi:multiple sugar transport system substrate-binding protein
VSAQIPEVRAELSMAQKKKTFLRTLRVVSLSCLTLIFVGLLAACGSAPASTTSNGKTVITEMDYWTTEPANTKITELFKQYMTLHPNITINRDAVPFGSLLSKADQEAASGTLPDVLQLDNPDLPNFAATGALTPLDSYLTGNLSKDSWYAGSYSTMTYKNTAYAASVGSNDLALFYNKKLLSAAKLTPPTTWAELTADAKTLTHGNTYGLALSAKATEEGTWQFLPFFWSNRAQLEKVDSAQGVASLQLLTDMVKQGSLSKASLNWAQGDVETQFQNGNAAMMVNGPWNLGMLDTAKTDYGVVPIPVPQVGYQAVSPLGGEIWTMPVTKTKNQKAAWDLIQWLEQPDQLLNFDKANGYIPPLKSVAQTFLQTNENLKVFAAELNTAQARTATVGENYPAISQDIWTAEQSAIAGNLSPQVALTQAQKQIDSALKK